MKLIHKLDRFVRRQMPSRWHSSIPNPALSDALGSWGARNSDIRDHLPTLFYETISARPKLIVELGTRGGVSTRALLAAAEAVGARVVSVDIHDCRNGDMPKRLAQRWTFVQSDDITFAGDPFESLCESWQLPARAEVIFIDTSHEYEHTKQELKSWLPRLTAGGVMMFHDTNAGKGWYRTLSGRAEPGGIGTRGVIQALEEQFGRTYDETTMFADFVDGYALQHVPWSSGFLVLRKVND